jgi:hypothetical protein
MPFTARMVEDGTRQQSFVIAQSSLAAEIAKLVG